MMRTNSFPKVAGLLLGIGTGVALGQPCVFLGIIGSTLTGLDSPGVIEAGDLDGDGVLDFACVNTAAAEVSLFLSGGSGGVIGRRDEPLLSQTNDVKFGDVDGDGDLDIVISPGQDFSGISGTVMSVLFNDGAGQFPERVDADVGTGATAIRLADADMDGDLDVLMSTWGQALMVVMNDGMGTFGGSAIGTDFVGAASWLDIADLDGDGDLDVALAMRADNEVAVMLNDGSGVFALSDTIGTINSPVRVAVGDINGDGHVDILARPTFGSTNAVILPNDGSGSFPFQYEIANGRDGDFRLVDFDGDDDLDILSTSRTTLQIIVTENNGNGFFFAPRFIDTPAGPGIGLPVDVNADGFPDYLVSMPSEDEIRVFYNGGDGDFLLSVGDAIMSPGRPYSLDIADLNGDGFNDVVSANRFAGTSTIHYSDQQGGLGEPETLFVGEGLFDVLAADLDEDGWIDLVFANVLCDCVSVAFGSVDGGFSDPVSYPAGNNSANIAVADFNGDGMLDIASTSSTEDTVDLLYNQGGRVFAIGGTIPTGETPLGIAAADVDDDGDQDLVNADQTEGTVSVHLNLGDGSFSERAVYDVGDGARALGIGDIDGDGAVDIVTSDRTSERISLLRGIGDGRFGTAEAIELGSQPMDVLLQDLNADGHLDIGFSLFDEDEVGVLLNDGFGVFELIALFPTGDGPFGLAAGQVVGGSALDLLWVNQLDGTVSFVSDLPQCVSPCLPDLAEPFGSLNFFDISAFIGLFNAGDLAVDFAAPFGSLNFFDVAEYIAQFNVGCP